MNTKTRILEYLAINGISKSEFYRITGLSNGFLDKTNNIGSDKLEIIISKFENLSLEWLVMGRGEMLKNPDVKELFKLKTDSLVENQNIPLYDLEAVAGLVPLFYNGKQEPINYIQIPHLPKCDGAVYVTGDSMYPLLKSGDIVLYKAISDFETGLFWGEMYLISIDVDGEEYISVKYVQKSDKDGFIKLVSYNQHHAEKEVKMSKIRALALVKASIRINSMR